MSRLSSPPVTITGRRMRTQRGSIAPVFSSLRTVASGIVKLFSAFVVDLVQRRVVHGDDVALGHERVGNVDRPARLVHEVADRAGHRRLAVARRAVDEHAAAADDRRADALNMSSFMHQMGERGGQRFGRAAEVPVTA